MKCALIVASFLASLASPSWADMTQGDPEAMTTQTDPEGSSPAPAAATAPMPAPAPATVTLTAEEIQVLQASAFKAGEAAGMSRQLSSEAQEAVAPVMRKIHAALSPPKPEQEGRK